MGDHRIVIARRTADASLRGLLALLAQKLVDEPVLGTDRRKSISSGPNVVFFNSLYMVIAYDNAQRRHGAMTFLLRVEQFLKFAR